MRRPRTHTRINRRFSGEIMDLADARARVRLHTNEVMRADALGLVHGGFLFSAADYAAMLAVDHPNVVLGQAETRFLAPLRVGQIVDLVAKVVETEGRKSVVEVEGMRAGAEPERVFEGRFVCHSLDEHVLKSHQRRLARARRDES